MIRLAIGAGGIAGALGVAVSAAGSHGGGDNLRIAGQFLLFHAPAFLAIAAVITLRLCHDRIGRFAILAMMVGLMLFAGDLAARALMGRALFPLAAPIGGISLLIGWLSLAIGALLARKSSTGD